jgi:putative endonuclease
MPYVYILKSLKNSKIYVGITADLDRRLKEHNQNKKSSFTKIYSPWEIIYKQKFDNFKDARVKEIYFKSAAGRKFVKKILNND